MNALFRTRWPLLLTGAVAVGWLGSWGLVGSRPGGAAAPPAAQRTTVYHPDPQHLWNRLHDTFRAGVEEGKAGDPWELDPFLWRNEQYLASEKGLKRSLDVLDEFLSKNGHT